MAAKFVSVILIKATKSNCKISGDFAKKEAAKLAHQTQRFATCYIQIIS
jgi:hypothetical protein